mmetsp:Transcript_71588/g.142037  ORF Transcript_71588/g.142037 Transcript_71588/m.142037 type:complete len:673 (+) Transcript_71588:210-2228(+)
MSEYRRDRGRSCSRRHHSRRHSQERSRSRSRRRRRRERSRSRSLQIRRELQQREHQRRERERELEERTPSATIVVLGIPDSGVTEEKLEAAAWETAVQAGCSMPNGVHFANDRNTQRFRGHAFVEFPHKEAAKMFKEHTNGLLEIDGFNLALKYQHGSSTREPSRSRSRDRGPVDRDEPSGTLIIKGIQASTAEATLAAAFQQFATVKDIRHFPRRGFAFVQFHTIEEATLALNRFERDCRSRLDGERVLAHYAKEREDGRYGPERTFLHKQALVTAEATAELDKLAEEQLQNENTAKALSGVNADMWASYMQSVAQTETVQSTNTFKFDKDSGYYLDSKAGLYYDPNTTYFFTTDCKKYFVYDHDEEQLCLVDSQGVKVPNGEKRPLPSQVGSSRGRQHEGAAQPREDRGDASRRPPLERRAVVRSDRSQERHTVRSRSRRKKRSKSASRHRDRDREKQQLRDRDGRRSERDPRERERDRKLGRSPPLKTIDGRPQPIYFPGGDPLAKLAPQMPPPSKHAPPSKKKRQPEGVLGLVSMPECKAPGVAPGPVTVFQQSTIKPGPVTLAPPPPRQPSNGELGAGRGAFQAPAPTPMAAFGSGAGRSSFTSASSAAASFDTGAVAAAMAAAASAADEWICEVCMRKFASQEMLQRHEQFSDLHRENLAKLNVAL